jgi:hypothetical protein
MGYVKPQDVLSPRDKGVKVLEVLLDEGEATDENGKFSAAIIEWKGKTHVGTRWNGTAHSPAGFPTSRGKPMWQVEHDELGTQLEALYRAKAKGHELDWIPPLKLEQHISELTKKGFAVTLTTEPANTGHSGDKIIITAVKDLSSGVVDGMQFCAIRGGDIWLGKLMAVPEFERLLRDSSVFPSERLESLVNQVRQQGQVQKEGLSVTEEQVAALGLRKQHAK